MNIKIVSLILFLLVMIFIIRLVLYKNNIKNKFSAIKKLINDRVDIINSIIFFLEVNCKNELIMINKLKEIKESFNKTNNINKLISLLYETKPIFNDMLILDSTYIMLSTNIEYNTIRNRINENDSKLQVISSEYNKSVDKYNKFINIFSKVIKKYNKYE